MCGIIGTIGFKDNSKLDLKNYTNFNYRIIKKRSWFLQSKKWISICEKLFKLRIKKDE